MLKNQPVSTNILFAFCILFYDVLCHILFVRFCIVELFYFVFYFALCFNSRNLKSVMLCVNMYTNRFSYGLNVMPRYCVKMYGELTWSLLFFSCMKGCVGVWLLMCMRILQHKSQLSDKYQTHNTHISSNWKGTPRLGSDGVV